MLPWTRKPAVSSWMPVLFPEITLPAPGAAPPIVPSTAAVSVRMPGPFGPRSTVPEASVPM